MRASLRIVCIPCLDSGQAVLIGETLLVSAGATEAEVSALGEKALEIMERLRRYDCLPPTPEGPLEAREGEAVYRAAGI